MVKRKAKVLSKVKKVSKKAPAAKKTETKKQNIASGKGKIMRGLVLAAKLPKTATVVVEYKKTHPLYGKSFRRSKKFLVHDEVGVKVGDVVEIHQVRPISKNKHFAVVKITGQNIEAIVTEQLKDETAKEIAAIMPEKVDEGDRVEGIGSSEEKVEDKKEKIKVKKEKKAPKP